MIKSKSTVVPSDLAHVLSICSFCDVYFCDVVLVSDCDYGSDPFFSVWFWLLFTKYPNQTIDLCTRITSWSTIHNYWAYLQREKCKKVIFSDCLFSLTMFIGVCNRQKWLNGSHCWNRFMLNVKRLARLYWWPHSERWQHLPSEVLIRMTHSLCMNVVSVITKKTHFSHCKWMQNTVVLSLFHSHSIKRIICSWLR